MALLISQNIVYIPLGLEVSRYLLLFAPAVPYALLSHPHSPKTSYWSRFQESFFKFLLFLLWGKFSSLYPTPTYSSRFNIGTQATLDSMLSPKPSSTHPTMLCAKCLASSPGCMFPGDRDHVIFVSVSPQLNKYHFSFRETMSLLLHQTLQVWSQSQLPKLNKWGEKKLFHETPPPRPGGKKKATNRIPSNRAS